MRIQWNSGAVEEALARLRSAQDGLEACKSRAQRIRRQFADANPDGENRALRAAENRFAQCWTQMQRLAERARGMGAEVLELQVLCSNAAAIHVYEKLGFSIAGTYRKFFRYGPGEYADAYWMNLYL